MRMMLNYTSDDEQLGLLLVQHLPPLQPAESVYNMKKGKKNTTPYYE